MRRRDSSSTQQSTIDRRRFLAATGVSVAGISGLAGCLGETGDSAPIADVDPLSQAVSSTAVSWDDLGDLEGEINIYNGRTPDQIDPVFDALETEYDGLTINTDDDDTDVHVNQILEEQTHPADLMYSQDPGALNELYNNDVLQPLPDDVVDAVPSSYQHNDGYWTGVTGRTRSIQYNSDRLDETPFDSWDELPTDISEYAHDDRFEDIISTRPNSGTFRGFIQAMVELEGEPETREWVEAIADDQNAQTFESGGNQAEAVNRGGNDDPIVALGNSYYAARILNEDPDAPIRTTYTENDAGCLFSVAGVGVLNDVNDAELVAEFVRHLLAEEGQEFMMDANGEYPVVEGVDYVGPLPDLEEINPPEFDLSDFDMELQEAGDLIDEHGLGV
ncbi:extracellular solute-binding protein [Natronobacterium gregoryi]|uniref:ABC transporter substrate-binding protein n=2 Tax=Natronobacterium gregoryi TaxID=44930 RepID=L0AI14_NATGS|nr:extracellular solute-binding protein [Natronobacterium gregoryi]AFZ72807.1 ABC-type Fe3+ transport system, periplasmic component [Natronobacterium gregoryi SP2]ELY69429.1 ABC transporter substrate-binding protein [Natronobacterium gregoryi SP2]PLK21147.1 iron ABC transporter substrate-binding protein [Natronobacterium gregoryi SP2]SFJ10284.1 iron(III) transport system substrate-binding protein [Natronobacterium gregoryi]